MPPGSTPAFKWASPWTLISSPVEGSIIILKLAFFVTERLTLYLKKVDKPIRIKLERYLPPKPFCQINCYCERSYVFWGTLIGGLITIGALLFAVINNITHKQQGIYPPPPK